VTSDAVECVFAATLDTKLATKSAATVVRTRGTLERGIAFQE
jgi:hypothetical protein